MIGVLLTWNPEIEPEFATNLSRSSGACAYSWRCTLKKGVKPGNPVFLLQVRREPRGMVAFGHVSDDPFDEDRFLNVEFKSWLPDVQHDPPYPRDRLRSEFPNVEWNTQNSGKRISERDAQELEKAWHRHLRSIKATNKLEKSKKRRFTDKASNQFDEPPEHREQSSVQPVRDSRNVRLLKNLYDHKCQVCGYRVFLPGKLGNGFSHVHHLRPLGKKHRGFDNIDNMLVLCPTCHAEFDLLTIAILPGENRVVRCPRTGTVNENRAIRFQGNHKLDEKKRELSLRAVFQSNSRTRYRFSQTGHVTSMAIAPLPQRLALPQRRTRANRFIAPPLNASASCT